MKTISKDGFLVIDEVTKKFSRGKITAVDRVSFRMDTGHPEIFTLAGESGSGKTTLIRMILHLIEPTSGSIHFRGRDITEMRGRKGLVEFMKEVQPIFQDPFETFNPLRRIDRYLYETALNYGVSDKKKVDSVINSALNSVGLSLQEVRGRHPHELSGGQVQRVSVARALIPNPSLLIADEPVSMVDASIRMSIVNLLKELKREEGLSIVYITHDLSTAYYLSDRIAIMFRGQVVEKGSVEDVLVDPLHPYTKILKDSVPAPVPDKEWSESMDLSKLETEAEEFARAGCKFAGRCEFSMEVCKTIEPKDFPVGERSVKCHLYDPDGEARTTPPW
jgi:peptide/nickel transport system ATP-binding protein